MAFLRATVDRHLRQLHIYASTAALYTAFAPAELPARPCRRRQHAGTVAASPTRVILAHIFRSTGGKFSLGSDHCFRQLAICSSAYLWGYYHRVATPCVPNEIQCLPSAMARFVQFPLGDSANFRIARLYSDHISRELQAAFGVSACRLASSDEVIGAPRLSTRPSAVLQRPNVFSSPATIHSAMTLVMPAATPAGSPGR